MNELIPYKEPGYGDYCWTPYSRTDWVATAEKFNIRTPDHIVDKTEGFSYCTSCGKKYVGCQDTCVNMVPGYKYRRPGGYSYHDSQEFGNLCKGDIFLDKYKDRQEVIWNGDLECKQRCKWELQEEFDKQREFFTFLDHLGYVPIDDSLMIKYADLLPEGLAQKYENRMLALKIQNLEMQNQQLIQALKQIAERMNQAGHALTFGF